MLRREAFKLIINNTVLRLFLQPIYWPSKYTIPLKLLEIFPSWITQTCMSILRFNTIQAMLLWSLHSQRENQSLCDRDWNRSQMKKKLEELSEPWNCLNVYIRLCETLTSLLASKLTALSLILKPDAFIVSIWKISIEMDGSGFFVDFFLAVVIVVWFLILETSTVSRLADYQGQGKNEGSQPTASSWFHCKW